MKAKICLIKNETLSNWKSCQRITPNIIASYQRAYSQELLEVSLPKDAEIGEISLAVQRLISLRPDTIVFVEHDPHPHNFLLVFFALRPADYSPQFVFHIYGDFTLRMPAWKRTSRLLEGHRILFLAASFRQKALASVFLVDNEKSVEVCPFPIDQDFFNSNLRVRQQTRDEYQLSQKDQLVLYAGRLSLQKNLLLLCNEIETELRANNNLKFFLAGPFDDIAAPFFDIKLQAGSYRALWEQWYQSLSADLRGRVRWLGELSAEKLAQLYNAADVYVSLSVHHDEDFGMAPLEALSCGARAILSDWGGYADFAHDLYCKYVPVKLSEEGLLLHRQKFSELLSEFLMGISPPRERVRSAYQSFAIEAVAELIKTKLNQNFHKFLGFKSQTPGFQEKAYLESTIAFPQGAKPNSIYQEYYQKYLPPEL